MDSPTTISTVERIDPLSSPCEQLALAGFLAGYSGLTREAYASDLRQFVQWCKQHELALFPARRADIECFGRELEAMGRARATVVRRLSAIVGFYRYAKEEGLIALSPGSPRPPSSRRHGSLTPWALTATRWEPSSWLPASATPATTPSFRKVIGDLPRSLSPRKPPARTGSTTSSSWPRPSTRSAPESLCTRPFRAAVTLLPREWTRSNTGPHWTPSTLKRWPAGAWRGFRRCARSAERSSIIASQLTRYPTDSTVGPVMPFAMPPSAASGTLERPASGRRTRRSGSQTRCRPSTPRRG